MNYYRRYSGDYLRDTSRLSMIEHGAYSLLLDYYYSEERPLPVDVTEIYTMVRAMRPEDKKAVDRILARYFDLRDDGYHNGRADEELAIASKIIETAKENGKLGGRPPKKPTNNPDGNPQLNLEDNPHETSGETGRFEKQAENVTHNEPANNHPPTTNHQPPASTHQPPTSNLQGQNQEKSKTRPQSVKKSNGHVFELPPEIDPELWREFVEMRNKIRKPLTERAKWLIVGRLTNLELEGYNPRKVLQQSIRNSWQDVFPIREEGRR